MIVVDASVVVELLLRTPDAMRIEERLFAAGEALHAPHLLDVEVTQVIRRYERARELTPSQATQALDVLIALPVVRHAHTPLIPRIWVLRANLTAYDAAYVALAEGLNATLLTTDTKLARARGHSALVELA